MNPFKTAAAQQQLGGPLQRRGPDGRLASSSGEVEISDVSGDAVGDHGGSHLSPSVSAMATVSIRSDSGPPAQVGGGWAHHGKGGSFLVPGALCSVCCALKSPPATVPVIHASGCHSSAVGAAGKATVDCHDQMRGAS